MEKEKKTPILLDLTIIIVIIIFVLGWLSNPVMDLFNTQFMLSNSENITKVNEKSDILNEFAKRYDQISENNQDLIDKIIKELNIKF